MAKLNITELDFESIKEQLKTYLTTQTKFKDYDFTGSNMSVLLDVMAYNTFQNNFYTNMAINEMFIDSAIIRNSVISHAKELNYLPRSKRSARAVVKVKVQDTETDASTITIPQYAEFGANFQGQKFTFVTDQAYVLRKTAVGVFESENITLYEGTMLTSFEREGGKVILILEIHQSCCVAMTKGQAGNSDQSSSPIAAPSVWFCVLIG